MMPIVCQNPIYALCHFSSALVRCHLHLILPIHCLDPSSPPSHPTTSQVNSNWFSGANALRVFSVYVGLDIDQDGKHDQLEVSSVVYRILHAV
jgi:hypothetical protein